MSVESAPFLLLGAAATSVGAYVAWRHLRYDPDVVVDKRHPTQYLQEHPRPPPIWKPSESLAKSFYHLQRLGQLGEDAAMANAW